MAEINQFFQKFKLTSKDTGTVCRLFVLAISRLNIGYRTIHWLSLCLLLICAKFKEGSRQKQARSLTLTFG